MTRALRTLAAVLAVAVAQPAIGVARADEPAPEQARESSRAAFKRGVAQLRAQDWVGARASFEQAWTLFPHPSILLNLGIARLRTGDPVLAEQDLVRFLSEDAGASADELASAREALTEARGKIGTLRVVVTPATASVVVDGKPIEAVRRADAVAGELRAKPGRHAISVTADGFAPQSKDVEVVAKADAEVKIALVAQGAAPKERGEQGLSTRAIAGWSAVGVAGVAVVTGGFFAIRAKTLADDYNSPTSGRFQDEHTKSVGMTFRTGADVALGVALISGAAAIVLLLTDVGSSTDRTDRTERQVPVLRF